MSSWGHSDVVTIRVKLDLEAVSHEIQSVIVLQQREIEERVNAALRPLIDDFDFDAFVKQTLANEFPKIVSRAIASAVQDTVTEALWEDETHGVIRDLAREQITQYLIAAREQAMKKEQ